MKDAHPEAQAKMVDVTAKAVTERVAVASGRVKMSQATVRLVMERSLDKG
ncbi:MAG: cyclic pyranopterin monophosphate synthase MoaC, partial [Actinomycetota bacterium]